VEETPQVRDVRHVLGCRIWLELRTRARAGQVQGLRQAGEQMAPGTGQDGIQMRGDLPGVTTSSTRLPASRPSPSTGGRSRSALVALTVVLALKK